VKSEKSKHRLSEIREIALCLPMTAFLCRAKGVSTELK